MSVRIKFEDEDHLMDIEPVDSADEDDEVVREIDVQLCPSFAQQIYLMQYPLQHADDRQIPSAREARIKPKHGLLEIDHPLPRSMETAEGSEFSGMTSRSFHSSTIPLQTHMCLGKLSPNSDSSGPSELHLVPLNHICQMRPSLKHVDELRALESTDSSTPEEEAAPKQKDKKPLAFQRKESERAAMIRKSSYSYKKASEASEEWLDLTVVDTEHVGVLEAIYKERFPGVQCVKKDKINYVETLNYMPPLSNDPIAARYTGNDLNCVAARLTILLHRGFPTPFQILRAQFDHALVSDTLLLKALSVCAVMIRGNYCLNSKFLAELPRNKKRARTFILLLLQERGTIRRKPLLRAFRTADNDYTVPPETLLVLLTQVAQKMSTFWQLKIEDDTAHILDYPEHHERNQEFWGAQHERFEKELALYDSHE